MSACFKCKSGAGYAPSRERAGKSYCTDCFENYVELQVRDGFFRHCACPPDTKIALAVSGGTNSMVMMNVLLRLREQNLARGGAGRVNFDFIVIHLNEHGFVFGDQAPMFTRVERSVLAVASSLGLTNDRIHTNLSVAEEAGEEHRENVTALLNSRVSLTEREDIYQITRRAAIIKAAARLGCEGVIFGDNAVTCAISALSNLARGRGAHLVSLAGSRGIVGDVAVMRPMRALLPKEMYLFAKSKGLPQQFTPAPGSGTSLRSLNRTIESFVHTLQINFKSTVFNVLQAVSKMQVPYDTTPLVVAQNVGGKSGSGRPPPIPFRRTTTASVEGKCTPSLCEFCGGSVETAESYYAGAPEDQAHKGDAAASVCYGCKVLLRLLPAEAGKKSSEFLGEMFGAVRCSLDGKVRLVSARCLRVKCAPRSKSSSLTTMARTESPCHLGKKKGNPFSRIPLHCLSCSKKLLCNH